MDKETLTKNKIGELLDYIYPYCKNSEEKNAIITIASNYYNNKVKKMSFSSKSSSDINKIKNSTLTEVTLLAINDYLSPTQEENIKYIDASGLENDKDVLKQVSLQSPRRMVLNMEILNEEDAEAFFDDIVKDNLMFKVEDGEERHPPGLYGKKSKFWFDSRERTDI